MKGRSEVTVKAGSKQIIHGEETPQWKRWCSLTLDAWETEEGRRNRTPGPCFPATYGVLVGPSLSITVGDQSPVPRVSTCHPACFSGRVPGVERARRTPESTPKKHPEMDPGSR